MPSFLSLFQNQSLVNVQNQYVAKELLMLNTTTQNHGITLSAEDCMSIARFRTETLIENERVEIGVGAVQNIIELFCDSGYVNQQNFTETVEALLECFYTIKTETFDKITDEDALDFLKYLYEIECGGDHTKLYESESFDLFIAKTLSNITFKSDETESDNNEY